ncbi:helicase-related protein [Terrilactibacillus sp. S3-3]|nr:helicase-related protein [Terrilactibacillus sp. S3-3]
MELPGLIYCASREWTEKLTELIRERLPLKAAFYHGGVSSEDRLKIQRQFLDDELDVLCCTNAFGMGINKPNIRLIVHFHYPKHLNAYLQEIGRAGRDGEKSLAIMLYMESDDRIPLSLIEKEYPSEQLLGTILKRLDREEVPLERERVMALMYEEGAGETATRFLWEQLTREKSRLMTVPYIALFSKCRNLIKERRNRQLADLSQMREWIREKGCRRAAILKFFNEPIQASPVLCCDACGVEPADFARKNGSLEQPGYHSAQSWEEVLKQLLIADK